MTYEEQAAKKVQLFVLMRVTDFWLRTEEHVRNIHGEIVADAHDELAVKRLCKFLKIEINSLAHERKHERKCWKEILSFVVVKEVQ